MAIRTTCDMPDSKGNPCGKDSAIEVTLSVEGKTFIADLCSQHGQQLANAGRPVTRKDPDFKVTVLPKAGPSVDQATKDWAIKKGGDTAAQINQRGRQPRALKEEFLSSPDGKVWAQNNS